jgi:hypothetical protein
MDYSNDVVVPFMFVAMVTCGVAAYLSFGRRQMRGLREPKIWALIGLVFLALIVMKVGGFFAYLYGTATDQMKADGFYDGRRPWQIAIVAGATLLAGAQVVWSLRHVHERWKRYRWAILGTGLIAAFAVIRATSLHELDAMKQQMTVAKVIVEVLGLGLVAWSAWRRVQEMRAGGSAKPRTRRGSEVSPAK